MIKLLRGHMVPIASAPPYKLLLQVQLEDGQGGAEARFLHVNVDTLSVSVESYKASIVQR